LLIGFGRTHTRNNFHYTYEKLKVGNEVNLFKDQYRTPLSLFEASEFIDKLISMNVKNEVVNFGGAERVSRHEIGKTLCDVCGFDRNLVKEISCREVEGVPQVPDVSMNTEKLRALGLEQKSLRESVSQICARGII